MAKRRLGGRIAFVVAALVAATTFGTINNAGAANLFVGGICGAGGALAESGSALISGPMLDVMQTTELPLTIPAVLNAESSIEPNGTITYDGVMDIDLATVIADLHEEQVKPAITTAPGGGAALAASSWLVMDITDLKAEFPLPVGTTPVGVPTVAGDGLAPTAAFDGASMDVDIESIVALSGTEVLPADSPPPPTDPDDPATVTASWTVMDPGSTPVAVHSLLPGEISFTLRFSVGVVFFGVPIVGAVTGPWSCVPTSPDTPLLSTIVLDGCDDVFGDVPDTHPFCKEIEWAADENIVNGFDDGNFRPTAGVTRQAFAAFMYRLADEPAFDPPATASFSDVPTTHPFFKEIEWLVAEGITTGFDGGTFRPGNIVTRQASAAFFYRFAGEPPIPVSAPTFSDVPEDHPFADEISWLASSGVTQGFDDGTFRPGNDVTRQATTAWMLRYETFVAGT